ncbi:unnamed protein product [Oppiella nova]|uniref:DNA mismatch repair proteins mutS family domain-containing protein n=1 Tax=Oppiella nova TaxID=334625 RepID=A0A7R9MA02_9ACAR|nr:unnamed protein product [Oppiella nova]CAG2173489.1 unnamed protein product [Oppiella nova]
MQQFSFYHTIEGQLYKTTCILAEKSYHNNLKVVILTLDVDVQEQINKLMWTYSRKHFIPHGSKLDPLPEKQPIYITHIMENPNNANILIITAPFNIEMILNESHLIIQAIKTIGLNDNYKIDYYKQSPNYSWSKVILNYMTLEQFRQKYHYAQSTKMIQQYLDIKFANIDCLVLFRMGDFYELFFDDAIIASKILSIALTKRGKNGDDEIAMCGVPYHSLETYLNKLIDSNYKVAICDQLETPEEAKKRDGYKAVVARDVTRIITPGTITEESLITVNEPHYLASIVLVKNRAAICYVDLSIAEIAVLDIDHNEIQDIRAIGELSKHQISAIGSIIEYLSLTQKQNIPLLPLPKIINHLNFMNIDLATRRNLEITYNLLGQVKGSLLDSIDYTITKSGRQRCLTRIMMHRSSGQIASQIKDEFLQICGFNLPNFIENILKPLSCNEELSSLIEQAIREDAPNNLNEGGIIKCEYHPKIQELYSLINNSKAFIEKLKDQYRKETNIDNLKISHNNVLDVFCNFAYIANEYNYIKPILTQDLSFEIIGGRHPVIEQNLLSNSKNFIKNDCTLSENNRIWLITGPNMAGKSTFLRQNALITILAQIGSFVPACKAKIGAGDDLLRGQSTFMLEMLETSAILAQATQNSLIILDEVGRGTATYDGVSIAWSVLEYIHDKLRCRCLFATHYHELTSMSNFLPSLQNHTVAIEELDKEVLFLHNIIPGSINKSYGIHVAYLAGLPKSVIIRARDILKKFEKISSTQGTKILNTESNNLSLFSLQIEPKTQYDKLREEIINIDPDQLSPKEALEILYKLKGLVDIKNMK